MNPNPEQVGTGPRPAGHLFPPGIIALEQIILNVLGILVGSIRRNLTMLYFGEMLVDVFKTIPFLHDAINL